MEIIKPLSEAVHSMVRSGSIIGCLTNVVEELLYNSLDAGATKVSVSVAVNNGYIKVEDDGSGISRDGLVLLGERYATSKLQHFYEEDDIVGSFGFRGEVLCSIADISLVEIVTKVQGRPNGYRKVMKGRKCLCLSIDNDRQDVGTTVIVRDLFYNQPVRRRQMQCSAKKVLHSVKKCALQIALVHPKICFKVIDMESEDELLSTRSYPSSLSLFCNNFGVEASSLHQLSFSEGMLKLTGYVSALSSSFASKAVHYIYVNSRFVIKGPIHKFLNRLVDMCHDQLRGNKGEKRGQPQGGPSYCLNLTCPRFLYDVNVEISRASVEFKDWAPVLSFFEKSVLSLWSEEIRGISHNLDADRIRKDGKEKVAEKTSVEQDQWLRTCQMSTKRRRILNSENPKPCYKDSVKMQVEDCNYLSPWKNIYRKGMNSERITVKFRDSETERDSAHQMDFTELVDASTSNCIFNVTDGFSSGLLESDRELRIIRDLLRNDVTTERESNYANNCLSGSRRKDEVSSGDPYAGSRDIRSIRSFEFTPEYGRNRVNDDRREFLLQSCSRKNSLQASLYSDNESHFQIDNFKEKRSCNNSHRHGDVDSPSKNNDSFERAQCQNELANTWPLPKSYIANRTAKDLDIDCMECDNLLPSCLASFDGGYPLQSLSVRGRVFVPCSPTSCAQESGIRYPSLQQKDWDFENLIQNEQSERRSGVRNSNGFEQSNHESEEVYFDSLGDECNNKNFTFSSCLNSTSLFTNELPALEKEIWEISPHGRDVNEISSTRFGDPLFEDLFSASKDKRPRDSSVCWSPITSGYDSMVNNEAISLCLDSQSNLSPYKPSMCLSSSTSTGESPTLNSRRCQILDPNPSFLESGRSVRSRRSHSAPPFHKGKKKYLSVKSSLFSATVNSALGTAPPVCMSAERTKSELPFRPALSSSLNPQHDGMGFVEDSLFGVEQKAKESSNITKVGPWSQDGKTKTLCFSSDYLKEFQDPESPQTKWREALPDAGLKDIANFLNAGDRLNVLEGENEIMDIQSCVLDLTGDSLVPKSISRKGLENAKVLWQIDNKYIPVVANGTLAVIDQHAADERIRLEEMRQKVLFGEMKSISYLEKEKDLVFPEMAYQLLCNYAEQIKHWGWDCNIFSQDSVSFAKNLNLLNEHAPHLTLTAVPCILGVTLSDTDLVEFLEQLADTDGSSSIPPSVVRILNYKACRGAIMFGDKLLPSECSLIVEELKRTSLCFQCAHGRPTTVPLVNLKALHKGILQLGSWHDRSKSTWHGLCRKEITLDRARRRLGAARGCE